MRYFFLILTFGICHFSSFAQQRKIDSLLTLLKNLKVASSQEFIPTIEGGGAELDTNRIKLLNALAWELMYSKPDTSIILSTQALNLCNPSFKADKIPPSLEKIRAGCIASSYLQLGVFNWLKGSYPSALDFDFKALMIWESLNNKKGISSALGNIGIVYRNQGNYPQALDYYFRALKIEEEFKNKSGIAQHLNNISGVYYFQNKYAEALNYSFKTLRMYEKLEDKKGISTVLANIGGIYSEQASTAKSRQDIIGSDSLIKKALDCNFRALKISEELGDKNGIAGNLGIIGYEYVVAKRYKDAEKYLQRALMVCDSIGALNYTMQFENAISELYEQTSQHAKALEHYKKYIAAKDSIFNEGNTKKTVRSEMNFEFEKKQAIEKAEQEKQNAIIEQEKQKQKIVLILVSCFLLLVAVFAIFMFNRWRVTQKQKLIIEKQKEKIVDSITYAQLIQQSILIEESEIQKYLPDSFIYFLPKDIVSGDFYWYSRLTLNSSPNEDGNKGELIVIAAVDCTGHGVPGAFMSMIGNTLLNQIVNEKQITVPSEILQHLNFGVTEALHQKKEGALSKDGMDIALCCIDYSTNVVQFAGAKNPLYILTDNNITVIAGDKQSIGGNKVKSTNKKSSIEYTNHTIPLAKGMSIYLFSDGYMDQFRDKDKKKFGAQKFKELLLNSKHMNMQQQKEFIASAHENWKGNSRQIDDILVMGFLL